MKMQTEAQQLTEDADATRRRVRYTVQFTELGGGTPDVTLVFDRLVFEGGSVESGVDRVEIQGSMLTGAQVASVAEAMPRLVALAYDMVALTVGYDMVALTVGAADGGIPAEVARAAAIYNEAVSDGRLPLKAVMKALQLSKPTASRRVRAAKDLGLIQEGGK